MKNRLDPQSPLNRNIDFEREFLYVHIPKTAGTAIKKGLGLTPEASHAQYFKFQQAIGKDMYNRFFKIAFVRNPWDRFLSFYFYARMEENFYHSNKNPEAFAYGKNRHYDLLINASLNDCAHYLIEGRFKPLVGTFYFLAPQCDWILDSNQNMQMDFIGKYESIAEDFHRLTKKLGITNTELEVMNPSKRTRKDFQHYYDPETKALIAKYYERDIDQFKYIF